MLNACPTEIDFDVYQPRNSKASAYYRCVEDHFEQLETVWDDRYQRRFGFWRSYVTDVIRRYLDCGDLQFGFARVKCEDCGHEYLLAFSCKRRHFCPPCHQKRVVDPVGFKGTRRHESGEHLLLSLSQRFGIKITQPGPESDV